MAGHEQAARAGPLFDGAHAGLVAGVDAAAAAVVGGGVRGDLVGGTGAAAAYGRGAGDAVGDDDVPDGGRALARRGARPQGTMIIKN